MGFSDFIMLVESSGKHVRGKLRSAELNETIHFQTQVGQVVPEGHTTKP